MKVPNPKEIKYLKEKIIKGENFSALVWINRKKGSNYPKIVLFKEQFFIQKEGHIGKYNKVTSDFFTGLVESVISVIDFKWKVNEWSLKGLNEAIKEDRLTKINDL